jgi:SAM-dependent methyltransferase
MQLAPKSGYQATDGAAYQVFLGRWTERLAAALLGSLELPPDGALLDVGCGTGSLAFAMAKHWPGRQVNGVDIAEPYVAFARARAVSGLPVFDLADICSMPYADGAFAAAIAQLVLNFVSDPAMALAEMRRVTRPAGLVAATVWDFRGGLVYQRMFWDTATVLDPTAASVRDRLFSAPLAPGDAAEIVHRGGFDGRCAPVDHHPHGLRELQRLLGASLWRAGAGRHLRRATRACFA